MMILKFERSKYNTYLIVQAIDNNYIHANVRSIHQNDFVKVEATVENLMGDKDYIEIKSLKKEKELMSLLSPVEIAKWRMDNDN